MKSENDILNQIATMARNEAPPSIRISSQVISTIEANAEITEQTLFYCSMFSASFALLALIIMGVWFAEMLDPVVSVFLFANSLS